MLKNLQKLILLVIFMLTLACGRTSDPNVTIPQDWPIGKPYKVDILGDEARIRLVTPNSTEEFSFIVYTLQSGNFNNKVSIEGNLTLGWESPEAVSKTFDSPENSTDTRGLNPMDAFLRGAEEEASKNINLRSLPKISPMFGEAQAENDPPQAAEFKVLNSYVDKNSYVTVSSTLYSHSSNSAIYVDNNTPPEIKDNPRLKEALERLRASFDDIISPIVRYHFGEESDVDGFSPIIILMSPVVNSIDTGGLGGVLGFFYSGDLLSAADYPSSNGTEIFYIATPEFPDSIDYVIDNVSHGTLAHEFQHMINFNQHVLKYGGEKPVEEVWLNEGLSHFAEELTGYGSGNIGRVSRYFYSPEAFPLVTGNDSSGTRGAAYLFLRYLYERFDPLGTGWFLKSLTGSPETGVKNISTALAADFTDLFEDWLVTLAISGSPVNSDPIYNYSVPADVSDDPGTGPFQIGINIRGANGSQILKGPKTEDLKKINLSMNPSCASFYHVTAKNNNYMDVSIKLENNSGSGVIVIPTRK